jgi:hypothetical protein
MSSSAAAAAEVGDQRAHGRDLALELCDGLRDRLDHRHRAGTPQLRGRYASGCVRLISDRSRSSSRRAVGLCGTDGVPPRVDSRQAAHPDGVMYSGTDRGWLGTGPVSSTTDKRTKPSRRATSRGSSWEQCSAARAGFVAMAFAAVEEAHAGRDRPCPCRLSAVSSGREAHGDIGVVRAITFRPRSQPISQGGIGIT